MAKNVLLVTADQFRGDCLSALGHDFVKTHHLDTLASDGALFHNHYCQATPCAPSRASLLTGLYQLNHRAVRNGPPLDRRHDNLARMVRRQSGKDPSTAACVRLDCIGRIGNSIRAIALFAWAISP